MLYERLRRIADSRPPNFVIGPKDAPYLRRWWVIPRNKWFNIYLHQILRSDDDRALHDHPWFNLSIMLKGRYIEHRKSSSAVRIAGQLAFRSPWTAHRLEVDDECWTLFITGPVMREWGFHCPRGWRHWKLFVDSRDAGQVGRGCD